MRKETYSQQNGKPMRFRIEESGEDLQKYNTAEIRRKCSEWLRSRGVYDEPGRLGTNFGTLRTMGGMKS